MGAAARRALCTHALLKGCWCYLHQRCHVDASYWRPWSKVFGTTSVIKCFVLASSVRSFTLARLGVGGRHEASIYWHAVCVALKSLHFDASCWRSRVRSVVTTHFPLYIEDMELVRWPSLYPRMRVVGWTMKKVLPRSGHPPTGTSLRFQSVQIPK